MFNLQSHQAVASDTTTFEEARRDVVEYAETELGLKKYIVYSCSEELERIVTLSGVDTIIVPENSYIFFVDEKPYIIDWGHSCSYLFMDKETKKIERHKSSLPPNQFEKWSLAEKSALSGEEEVAVRDGYPYYPTPEEKLIGYGIYKDVRSKSTKADNSYAVLINGGADALNNYSRYWNNIAMMYQMLVDVYGYKKENIYVLFSGGEDNVSNLNLWSNWMYEFVYGSNYTNAPTDFDGDGISDVTYAATLGDIESFFDELSMKLTNKDNLLIFTTDHGAETGEMCLWNNEYLTPEQLKNDMRKIDANSISIVMTQCYSGSFVNALHGDKLSISASSLHTESSFSIEPSYSPGYSVWGRYWIAAMAGYDAITGEKIDADANGDGNVSYKEAYDYATYQFSIYPFALDEGEVRPTPCYYSYNEVWDNMFLGKQSGVEITDSPVVYAGDFCGVRQDGEDVVVNLTNGEIKYLSVYDVHGVELIRQNSNRIRLEENGFYILKVTSEQGEIYNYKLLFNKK